MTGLTHIVVMGVSGCGKSTTGDALAARLGWPMLEGDSFHPEANVEKMHAGIPLDDSDRAPWLQALADQIAQHEAEGKSSIISCSSLKRAYRDILRSGAPAVRFVHVHGSRELLMQRLESRQGHFFPAKLLDSQLATLELLAEDEDGVVIDMGLGIDAQTDAAVAALGLDQHR